MHNPPRGGQPLYKGQIARPQCVLSSEVFTVNSISYIHALLPKFVCFSSNVQFTRALTLKIFIGMYEQCHVNDRS